MNMVGEEWGSADVVGEGNGVAGGSGSGIVAAVGEGREERTEVKCNGYVLGMKCPITPGLKTIESSFNLMVEE